MKKLLAVVVLMLMVVLVAPKFVAQDRGKQFSILIPESSIPRAGRAHTNYVFRVDSSWRINTSTPQGETPASLRAIYNLPSSGGGGTIAIIGASLDKTVESDLNVFSTQFGLPACTIANGCLSVIVGSHTRIDCGFTTEQALDLEWAHAMAPNAKLVLVEANSASLTDLLAAVDVATNAVLANGRGEVSMSWGFAEFAGELTNDGHFQHDGIVYVAASGDAAQNSYPSVSSFVVSAGGTSVNRDSGGNFVSETAWSNSGGGVSQYELKPTYQNGIAGTDAMFRTTPDFAFDADPSTGVAAYSTCCKPVGSCGLNGWAVVGGTSVSAPALAGIINLAGNFYLNSSMELSTIYGNIGNSSDFRDIPPVGYDIKTGVGSNQGLSGK